MRIITGASERKRSFLVRTSSPVVIRFGWFEPRFVRAAATIEFENLESTPSANQASSHRGKAPIVSYTGEA